MRSPATAASRWTLWDWQFLEPEHHELARRTVAWNAASHALHDNVDFTERCRAIVKSLGDAGLLDQVVPQEGVAFRSEEHTSELQSLMRISYAVFCLKKKKQTNSLPANIHKLYNGQTTTKTY